MLQEPGVEQELKDFMQRTSNPNKLSSVWDRRICQNHKAHDGTPFFGKADHTDLTIGVVMHYDGCVVLILVDPLLTRSQVLATSRPVFWVSYIRCTFLCICWVGNREMVLSATQYDAWSYSSFRYLATVNTWLWFILLLGQRNLQLSSSNTTWRSLLMSSYTSIMRVLHSRLQNIQKVSTKFLAREPFLLTSHGFAQTSWRKWFHQHWRHC